MDLRKKRVPSKKYQGDGTYTAKGGTTTELPAAAPSSAPPNRGTDRTPATERNDSLNPVAGSIVHTTSNKMANVWQVRTRDVGTPPPPPRRRRPRASSRARSPEVEDIDTDDLLSYPPNMKSASFPSLDFPRPASPAEDDEDDGNRHGIKRLIKDKLLGGRKVDRMYSNGRFPSSMSANERKWYRDLKDRLELNEDDDMILFRSLYYSLRITIMENIIDECGDDYNSPYYPVTCILGLTPNQVLEIRKEDASPWDISEERPEHLHELKRQFPDTPIDPDTPPPGDLVKAIKYLRQNHLPGSLLGQWQYPLPSIEAFHPPPSSASITAVSMGVSSISVQEKCSTLPSTPASPKDPLAPNSTSVARSIFKPFALHDPELEEVDELLFQPRQPPLAKQQATSRAPKAPSVQKRPRTQPTAPPKAEGTSLRTIKKIRAAASGQASQSQVQRSPQRSQNDSGASSRARNGTNSNAAQTKDTNHLLDGSSTANPHPSLRGGFTPGTEYMQLPPSSFDFSSGLLMPHQQHAHGSAYPKSVSPLPRPAFISQDEHVSPSLPENGNVARQQQQQGGGNLRLMQQTGEYPGYARQSLAIPSPGRAPTTRAEAEIFRQVQQQKRTQLIEARDMERSQTPISSASSPGQSNDYITQLQQARYQMSSVNDTQNSSGYPPPSHRRVSPPQPMQDYAQMQLRLHQQQRGQNSGLGLSQGSPRVSTPSRAAFSIEQPMLDPAGQLQRLQQLQQQRSAHEGMANPSPSRSTFSAPQQIEDQAQNGGSCQTSFSPQQTSFHQRQPPQYGSNMASAYQSMTNEDLEEQRIQLQYQAMRRNRAQIATHPSRQTQPMQTQGWGMNPHPEQTRFSQAAPKGKVNVRSVQDVQNLMNKSSHSQQNTDYTIGDNGMMQLMNSSRSQMSREQAPQMDGFGYRNAPPTAPSPLTRTFQRMDLNEGMLECQRGSTRKQKLQHPETFL